VLDPGSGVDRIADVAVSGTRIAAVEPQIAASSARRSLDVSGLYVVPGLVDLHTHVFGYSGSLLPDETALPAGTTTVVDAGGSGWRTVGELRGVAAQSRTCVLAFINIVGSGMVGTAAESNPDDMDPVRTAAAIRQHRDLVVGVKTAHFGRQGWTAIDRSVEAARAAGVPVMVDDHIFTNSGRTTREKLLDHLRPGDIHTHLYNDRQLELVDRFSGSVQEYMWEARRRGVLFDLGHGAGSFLWPVAGRAAAQGFLPDTISTDLHRASVLLQESDMPNCISKLMLLGMSLPDAILRSTANPAKAIGRYPEIGTLRVEQTADIAVLQLEDGVFAFNDAWGAKRLGRQRVVAAFTVRAGGLVYSGGRRPPRPPGEIYDVLLKNCGQLDVAVIGKKIARIARNLPAAHARVVIEAGGYRVAPGVADLASRRGGDQAQVRIPPGTVAEGADADLSLFSVEGGWVRCALAMRGGAVLWDTDGLTTTDWIKAGPYSNFR